MQGHRKKKSSWSVGAVNKWNFGTDVKIYIWLKSRFTIVDLVDSCDVHLNEEFKMNEVIQIVVFFTRADQKAWSFVRLMKTMKLIQFASCTSKSN